MIRLNLAVGNAFKQKDVVYKSRTGFSDCVNVAYKIA